MPRRISSASRTPSVVSRPHLAPVPVSVVLVVTVVPCTMVSMVGTNASSDRGGVIAAAILAMPFTTAIDGSAGVDSVLKIAGSAPSRVSTKSVKVPPTSIPIFSAIGFPPCWFALFFPLRAGRLRDHLAQVLFSDLAQRGLRQLADEHHFLRMLVAGDAALEQLQHGCGRKGVSAFRRHYGTQDLRLARVVARASR